MRTKKKRALSPARVREFRGRRLRRWFGPLKQRTQRWEMLVRLYGVEEATRLSARVLVGMVPSEPDAAVQQ